MRRWFCEEPAKPTDEEFAIYARVQQYWVWLKHQNDVNRGLFEFVFKSNEPPTIVTDHAEQVATDEVLERFGFTVIKNDAGETIGCRM